MSEYITRNGDTFESISRELYGVETNAQLIRDANPGASEPLPAGLSMVAPPDVTAPKDRASSTIPADPDSVSIEIEGVQFKFWESVAIEDRFDGISVFRFNAPFTPADERFREIFKPFSYPSVQVFVGNDVIFTGTTVAIRPQVDESKRTITVSGYATPGVLNDCTPYAPNETYQLEFNNANIVDIAYTLGLPLGVQSLAGYGAPGPVFERVAIEPGQRVLPWLANLAKQRNLVISNDANGEMIFQKEEPSPSDPTSIFDPQSAGSLVASLAEGSAPVTGVTPRFREQEFYSHITALEPVLLGLPGSSFTVKNTNLKAKIRPLTYTVTDTKNADVQTAAEAKAGRMFANAAEYILDVNTWRAPSGRLWETGQFVQLNAPGAMIYSDYTFMIKSINFSRTSTTTRAALTLIMPGGFSGQIPESLPWA